MSNIRELSQLAASIVVDDSTRNIGIGTSSPASKLSVGGDLNVSGVITATSFYGDGSNLSNIVSGVGISSNGVIVGTGITSLDFVGVSVTSITEENGNATIRFKNNDGINGIEVLDDISSNFNGQETTFALSSNSTSISALNPQQLIVNLGGVLQSPGSDYSVSDSNIIFSTPPQSGLTFSAVSIGVTVGINVPADGSVTFPKIASGVLGVGIQSAGVVIGSGITALNFVGAGNTFDVNGNVVDISISGGGGASVSIGTEAPSNPSAGDLWYNSTYGRTFIYYSDEDSSQWVDSAPFNLGVIDVSDLTVGNLTVTSHANVSGVITATSFYGDGSNLTGAGSSVVDDTTTDATFYPTFTQQTSGIISASSVSTTKLTFNPSSGTLSSIEFDATSDRNLKENIKNVENPIDKIMKLNGVTFDWKETKDSSIGVIAQEVEKVFPELVNQLETHKSVNYNGLIGVLIEVVKEQQKQIDELKKIYK